MREVKAVECVRQTGSEEEAKLWSVFIYEPYSKQTTDTQRPEVEAHHPKANLAVWVNY